MPPIWRFEVANALQMAIRRKRIDTGFRERAFAHLRALPIIADSESEGCAWSATVALAERHTLTVYDAAYLELAQRARVPLAALDRALIRAGKLDSTKVLGEDAFE